MHENLPNDLVVRRPERATRPSATESWRGVAADASSVCVAGADELLWAFGVELDVVAYADGLVAESRPFGPSLFYKSCSACLRTPVLVSRRRGPQRQETAVKGKSSFWR